MPSPVSSKLYQEIIKVSQDYLGPAADRFIKRQIITHLDKAPERLTVKDLPILIDWIKPTFALLTNDTELVESFIDRLAELNRPASRRGNA